MSTRPIAEWEANDAELFREELAKAMQSICADIAKRLNAAPDAGAVARVAALQITAETNHGPADTGLEHSKRIVEP